MIDVSRFHRDGYLVVDGFFSGREIGDVSATVERLSGRFETDGEVYDCLAMTPQFLRIVAKRETQEIVNAILGRPSDRPLYCFTNRCRIDRPNDERRTYGWHQEVFYTIPDSRFVQTWAPMVRDTTVANGTIEVCPGSHIAGTAPQAWHDVAEGRAHQIIVDPREVAKYPARPVPMSLGAMMFFDSRLFHRSGRNTSNETRYSLVGMYHDPDHPGFRVPRVGFDYRGQTPRQSYDQAVSEGRC